MGHIHYQEASSMMGEESKSKRLNVELPFFSKFLLLAAFLASYNPAKTDKRFFMTRKSQGRVIKKSKRKVVFATKLFLAASAECSAGSNDHFVVVVVVVVVPYLVQFDERPLGGANFQY
jgi:hypothetical protein